MGNLYAHLALLAVNIIYAVSYGFSQDVLNGYIPPFAFILVRVFGANLLFWLLALVTPPEKIHKEDLKLFILCGLFGVAANQLMFYYGLSMTSTINSAVIMTGTPLIVLLATILILKQKLYWLKIIGVFLGLAGALGIILSGNDDAKVNSVGDAFVLLNAASYGVYLVIVKPLMKKYKPLTVIRWVFTFGLIIVLPFGISQWSEVNWEFPADILWKIGFIILFMTFFTYLLTIYGLNKVSPVVVSVYIYLQPILAALIAVPFRGENLSVSTVCFGLTVFLGVFLASIPRKNIAQTEVAE